MKLKRNSLVALFTGFLILFVGAIIPIVYWQNNISNNGAIGIIGGADAPTYKFVLLSLFDGLPFVLALLGVSLILSSVFCLLFSNTVKAHCNINTTAISLGLSAVGALGLICVFLWFTIVSFHEMSKHPITYPFSILVGLLCFFTFLILLALYFKTRKSNWSIKGFLIDILMSIVYLPTFFFTFAYLYEILG